MSGDAISIDLVGSGWVMCGNTQAHGSAFLGERCLTAAHIAEAVELCSTEDDWQRTVTQLNGCFAVISRRGVVVLAAVDRVRSIPLFFARIEGRWLISDSALRIRDCGSAWAIDAVADSEFQLTGYVTGTSTLLSGLHQVQAGESLRWNADDPGEPRHQQYYWSQHGDVTSASTSDLIARLDQVHRNVFKRLVQGTGNRTIVVPLSGGYDSRLIAVSLRDVGAKDVICYSYGLPGNWEARISAELARYLGFRWEFVPYSAVRWRAWALSRAFRNYVHTAGNLASIPHIQDWPAVAELHREGKIPRASVIVPGHSGDFIAGSHIPRQFMARKSIPRREVLGAIRSAHYSLWDWPSDIRHELAAAVDCRIEAIVGAVPDCSPAMAADLFERWDLQERQAKFICNSVRVYEDFGYEWRLPLFDHELMDFWARVPVELRVGRSLYFQFVQERQRLPLTSANTDRNAFLRGLIACIDAAGLRQLARRARRFYRTLRWRRDYEFSSLAWNSIVDQEFFRHSYTGDQIVHAYVALAYRDSVVRLLGERPKRTIIPAIATA